MGTRWAGYSTHFQRFVYSKNAKNAQKEPQATKTVALLWFHRYKSFDTITPNKSYTEALKTNSTVCGVGNKGVEINKPSNKY